MYNNCRTSDRGATIPVVLCTLTTTLIQSDACILYAREFMDWAGWKSTFPSLVGPFARLEEHKPKHELSSYKKSIPPSLLNHIFPKSKNNLKRPGLYIKKTMTVWRRKDIHIYMKKVGTESRQGKGKGEGNVSFTPILTNRAR